MRIGGGNDVITKLISQAYPKLLQQQKSAIFVSSVTNIKNKQSGISESHCSIILTSVETFQMNSIFKTYLCFCFFLYAKESC